MKTTIGKVLAVTIAVCSLIFLGFVTVAVWLGGPNWETQAATLEGYTFTRTDTPVRQWSGAAHVGDATLPTSPVIEPVLAAAYDDVIADEKAETTALTERVAPLQQQIDEAEATTKVDLAAFQARLDEYSTALTAVRTQTEATAKQVEAQAIEVQKLEQRLQSRREDVLRLSAQVEDLRADEYRVGQIQQQLRDLIQQIDSSIERAERRRQQLAGDAAY